MAGWARWCLAARRVERFQLNEESLWSGFPRDCDNPDAVNHLPEVRKAVFDGDYLLADALCTKMQGPFTQSYQPMADLRIEFEHDGEISGLSALVGSGHCRGRNRVPC